MSIDKQIAELKGLDFEVCKAGIYVPSNNPLEDYIYSPSTNPAQAM